jgi:Tfp pilus assembly protein PilX
MSRSRDDRGSALLAAIGALLVMSLLAGLAFKAATASSDGSNADARGQAALQAAEAGLQTAAYRLNMLQPAPAKCVGTAVVAPTDGVCPSSAPESLGNGATFSYRTTTALGPGDACAGLSVRAQLALTQRCVTSVGTVDGVTRRVQARVAAYASTPLFPVAGILGTDAVSLTGNVQIRSTVVATNGELAANGNVETGGTILGPKGTTRTTGNVDIGEPVRRSDDDGPYVLGDVDPGDSATDNDNGRIANGLRTPPVPEYDKVAGSGVTYDAAKRALKATGNATLTLGGGVYNFCSVSITGNFQLVIPSGAKVSIYVDSPENPDSGCPSGSGGFSISGNFTSGSGGLPTAKNPGSDPTDLQLYVFGTGDDRDRISITGNSDLRAAIYAPRSVVSIVGNAQVVGGIAAQEVKLTGNGFAWDARAGGLQTGSSGLYHRTAWRECRSAPAAGAGC